MIQTYETQLWDQTRDLVSDLPTSPEGPSLYVRRLLLGSTSSDEGTRQAMLFANTEWTDQHTTLEFGGLSFVSEATNLQELFNDIRGTMGDASLLGGSQNAISDKAPLQSLHPIKQAELARLFMPSMLSLNISIPNSVERPFLRPLLYRYGGGFWEADILDLERLAKINSQLGRLVQGETIYFTVEDVSPVGKMLGLEELDVHNRPGHFSWAPYL